MNYLTNIFDDYPEFFSSTKLYHNKVEFSFAGYKKDDISAKIDGNSLVLSAENEDRGKTVKTLLIGRNVDKDKINVKYDSGLITVEVKPKKKEQTKLKIE